MVVSDTVDQIPIATDESGTIRVGGTRVTLDLVIAAHKRGLSAEEIAGQYPLTVADVYQVIGYFLKHQSELAAYLEARREEADALFLEYQRRGADAGLLDRLLARRTKSK